MNSEYVVQNINTGQFLAGFKHGPAWAQFPAEWVKNLRNARFYPSAFDATEARNDARAQGAACSVMEVRVFHTSEI